MTRPPEDDRLVEFLRSHQPVPPPARPALEHQIMAAVERAEKPPVLQEPHRAWHRRAFIPAIAASCLVAWGGWVGWRDFRQPAELAAADFLAETWVDSVYGEEAYWLSFDPAEPDWLFSVYANPY